ncbi:hypothetical protein Hanom_Chr09g00766381 [Helianthus anomalus]
MSITRVSIPTNFPSMLVLKKCSFRETSLTICWMNLASWLCVKEESVTSLRIRHET